MILKEEFLLSFAIPIKMKNGRISESQSNVLPGLLV